eukprot:6204914-Pleurochrysis_carterae.AAC.1
MQKSIAIDVWTNRRTGVMRSLVGTRHAFKSDENATSDSASVQGQKKDKLFEDTPWIGGVPCNFVAVRSRTSSGHLPICVLMASTILDQFNILKIFRVAFHEHDIIAVNIGVALTGVASANDMQNSFIRISCQYCRCLCLSCNQSDV